MSTANPEAGAETIEVTDVDSAARALLAKQDAREAEEETQDEVETEVEETEEEADTEEPEGSDDQDDEDSDEREAEEESEDPQFHSVDELAEALDLSPEEFKDKITAKIKVNGEVKEVNLAELTKGYQLESDYRHKTMELADNRRAFEAETEQQRNDLTARIQEANTIVATLEQSVLGEYKNVDWNTLRATDPGEFAALQAEYTNRYNALQQIKGQTEHETQRLQAENDGKQKERLQDVIKKETAALLDVLPEWKDETVQKQQSREMRDYLKANRFSDDEINQLVDHRMVVLIRNAMKGETTSSKIDLAKKKVIKAPKLQKAGTKPSKQQLKSQKFNDLRAKIKRTGSVDDVAALLLAKSS